MPATSRLGPGCAPSNHESAGKRLSGKTRRGSPWLRSALVEAAHAAMHSKDSYLSAQYRRLALRRGGKKATIAVGHTLLVIIYHLLSQKKDYQELGGKYARRLGSASTSKAARASLGETGL